VISFQFHTHFRKQYKKSPLLVRKNFDDRLQMFVRFPFHPLLHNHPLTGNRSGEWSINVTGDWRAIYEHLDENAVRFLEINTHGNLYKK